MRRRTRTHTRRQQQCCSDRVLQNLEQKPRGSQQARKAIGRRGKNFNVGFSTFSAQTNLVSHTISPPLNLTRFRYLLFCSVKGVKDYKKQTCVVMMTNDYSTTNATMRRDDDIEECDGGGPGIVIGRRNNNNIVVILLCLLAASSLLIGVGIGAADRWTEGRDDGGAVVVTSSSLATTTKTQPPPTATAPTASTTASTSSMMYCRRKLDLPVSQPYNTQIDVHGKHMIVVTRETKTTNVHVIFYTRNIDDEDNSTDIGTTLWNYVEDNHFILDHGSRMDDNDNSSNNNNNNDDDDSNDLALEKISVSLSDTSALVGLPYTNFTDSVLDTGLVYIFERTDQTTTDDDDDDDVVIWKKIDTTLQPTNDVIDNMSWYLNETVRYFYFGSSIDIVDDIACVVSDYSPNGWGEPKVYVYQRSVDNDGTTSWKQIRRLELNYPPSAKECFVGDIDTLAVQVDDYTVELFKYDHYDGNYKLLQTKIKNDWMESVSFDNEYLIYSTKKEYDIYTEYDCYETRGFTIYRRQEVHQPYILQQTINVSESSRCAPEFHSGLLRSLFHIERTGYESSIYHDDDMLVVRGDDRSIVYLKNEVGYWDEALTLNGGVYRSYHVSEQQLLAISYTLVSDEDEIYYFDLSKVYSSSSRSNNNVIVNVEDCFSPPTQMPTLSLSPSILTPTPTYGGTYGGTSIAGGIYRTQYPTFNTIRCQDPWLNLDTSSTTLLTQSYVPPESCDYSLDIVIAFDDNPSSMSWDVQLVDDEGGSDNVMVKAYKGVPNDAYQLRNESLCVDEGVYVFNIYGKGGIKYPGYYDVRVLGELVTRGDEFDCSATVTFAIPFTGVVVPPVAVTMPSMTLEPSLNFVSSTLSPSALTVSTELPTSSTCTVVDISVTFDDFPEEISWVIRKVNTIGTNKFLKVFNGTLVEDVQQKRKVSVCLSDGSYEFTIYDSAGDGLYDPGAYKVTTTDGVVIARNNSFDSFEDATLFSIPMN